MESAAVNSSEVHEVDSKTYPSFLTVKEGCSKIIPSFFTIKEGSTFLTKPLFNSLYDPFGSPYRGQKPSGTRGCNRPTVLNFLPLRLSCKESSTFSPSSSSSGSGDVTALQCSEPLRSKVGGPKRSSPYFARWDRRGWEVYNLQFIINSLLFRVNSLQLIFGGFC